jgi:ubiquinone/menaquinone biosynthesis C-methylase UbiE
LGGERSVPVAARGTAAELYHRYLVPAVTAPWAADLLTRAGLRRDERVLDVACGTGVVARMAAERVGAGGRVVGLDINHGMLAVARTLPVVRGAEIGWLEGSVSALPFTERTFDAVVCQLGLQFFPDRPQALREIRRVLAAQGRLALNVFSEIERNPAAHALADALERHLGEGTSLAKRSEHALADTEELRALLTAGGFDRVVIQTARKAIRFPSVREYVRIQVTATPLAALTAALEAADVDQLLDALSADLAAAPGVVVEHDLFAFPQEVHVALARS